MSGDDDYLAIVKDQPEGDGRVFIVRPRDKKARSSRYVCIGRSDSLERLMLALEATCSKLSEYRGGKVILDNVFAVPWLTTCKDEVESATYLERVKSEVYDAIANTHARGA